jgi:ribosomal protein S27AE
MSDFRNMTRLAPGVYDDGRGGLHLDIAELLAASGYADTPENRETLIAAAREYFQVVEVVDSAPPCYRCPRCGAISFNPHDREQKYCGRCHQFEDP